MAFGNRGVDREPRGRPQIVRVYGFCTDQGHRASRRLAIELGGARDRVGNDIGTQHLHVPVRRVLRTLADDVDVIELECGIAHSLCASYQEA